MSPRDDLRQRVAQRLLVEAGPDVSADLLISRAAGIEGVHRLNVAAVFWELVRIGYLDRNGRKTDGAV